MGIVVIGQKRTAMAFLPKSFTALIGVAGLAFGFAAHAEDTYDIMTGRTGGQVQSPPSVTFGYGENPAVEFPPRALPKQRISQASGVNSFCIRTCDGRYFPSPSTDDKQSRAQGCKNLCPASETRLFSGSSIDDASSKDGRSYSALPNAFRYRKELVAGCTCNGKDGGLASIKIEEDKTLRQGDIVATANGLEVVNRIGNGEASFSTASRSITKKFQRFPVVASE